MILEIALGIVLAVLILALLPYILVFGFMALIIAVVLGALGMAWVFASQATWTQGDLEALAIFAAIATAVVGLVAAGKFFERLTSKKVREEEFHCVAVFGPMAAYMLFLASQDILEGSDHLQFRIFGFAASCLPLIWAGIRIRSRRL